MTDHAEPKRHVVNPSDLPIEYPTHLHSAGFCEALGRTVATFGFLEETLGGGRPKNPVWVYNLRANPDVEIRDKTEVFKMRIREVTDDPERGRLWTASAKAFPPYDEYQTKTTRKIPVFIAEPVEA